MTRYSLDQQLAEVLGGMGTEGAPAQPLRRGDWRTLRQNVSAEYIALAPSGTPVLESVSTQDVAITCDDGWVMRGRWYSRGDDRPGSAVVYAHGGGMVAGSIEDYDRMVSTYVAGTGVPFLSVDYRLSPEAYDARPSQDVLCAVRWLAAHSASHGVDTSRLALMGDSSGGGVAASAAILARDAGVALSKLVLVYPMLDDRVDEASEAIEPFLTWTADQNATGWGARIRGDVTPITAPGRLEDCRGLASTYIEIGDLDLFRDECIRFAQALAAGDVPLELHVHPGVPHGYDGISLTLDVVQRALADRLRVIKTV